MTPKEMVSWLNSQDDETLWEAAIIIERMARELDMVKDIAWGAEKALEPFSVLLGNYSSQPDSMSLGCGFGVHGDVRFHFTVGDMRRAASTLAFIRALKGE